MAVYKDNLVPGYSTFAHLPLMHWEAQNCMNWGYHICQKYGIDRLHIDIGALSQTNGQQLMQATERDFCSLIGDQYGSIFYKEIKKIKKSMNSKVQLTYTNSDYNTRTIQSQHTNNLDPYSLSLESSTSCSYPQNLQSSTTSDIQSMDFSSTSYGYNQDQHDSNNSDNSSMGSYLTSYSYQDLQSSNTSNPYIPSMSTYSTNYNYHQDLEDSNSSDIPSMDSNSTSYNYHQNPQCTSTSKFQINGNLESSETEYGAFLDSYDKNWDICDDTWANNNPSNSNLDLSFDALSLENDMFDSPVEIQSKANDRQARQTSTQNLNMPAGCIEDIVKRTPGVAKRDRAPKSWEFLMRLLVNSETNPSLIRWEDESQYTFRLVQPDAIVQIWNTKSDKASPNKDNFARSLRYHYKKNILFPVPEKQLVYRCGPKAIEYINHLRQL